MTHQNRDVKDSFAVRPVSLGVGQKTQIFLPVFLPLSWQQPVESQRCQRIDGHQYRKIPLPDSGPRHEAFQALVTAPPGLQDFIRQTLPHSLDEYQSGADATVLLRKADGAVIDVRRQNPDLPALGLFNIKGQRVVPPPELNRRVKNVTG